MLLGPLNEPFGLIGGYVVVFTGCSIFMCSYFIKSSIYFNFAMHCMRFYEIILILYARSSFTKENKCPIESSIFDVIVVNQREYA